jgi:hypothetical protein
MYREIKELNMKRNNVKKLLTEKPRTNSVAAYMVTQRLDESLPLQTDEWSRVEQSLMRLSEFAPNCLVAELVEKLATWADDQARRGYVLGQQDILAEMKERSVA